MYECRFYDTKLKCEWITSSAFYGLADVIDYCQKVKSNDEFVTIYHKQHRVALINEEGNVRLDEGLR